MQPLLQFSLISLPSAGGFNLCTIYFCIFICSLNFICNYETTEMNGKSKAVCWSFVLKNH